jgi:hypothetical protein
MTIICMHCGHIIGTKDGHGVIGLTSGICSACLWLHYPQYAARVVEAKRKENEHIRNSQLQPQPISTTEGSEVVRLDVAA